ncbi:rhomboid family intramembrane serine protease [Sphingobacterium hungaricum]
MRSAYAIKDFWRETYKTDSPIPFIITAQVVVFLVVHLFKLLSDTENMSTSVYTWVFEQGSLPNSFAHFIKQPWSILTYSFLYANIFNLLFDCLWLYFIGNTFLNLLNRRQFLTVYCGGALLGGALYLLFNEFPVFSSNSPYLNTSSMALGALIMSTTTLVPRSELRLFLFGNVKLYVLAAIFLILQFGYFFLNDKTAAISYALVILTGYLFMQALKNGKDWSLVFKKRQKRKLKVVHHAAKRYASTNKQNELSNQEVIDGILDKISADGYESLTSQEKETLFKASKED